MFRLFSYLAAISLLLLLVSGAGVFWIASGAMEQAKKDTVGALAKGIGLSISAQLDLLSDSLDKMAQDTHTVQALASQNPESIRQTAAQLTPLFPHALIIRLLLPDIIELDVTGSPPMTYADLNMVRETLSTNRNPLPAIQGDGPNNRHLAIARKVVQGEQTIGVLLASFDDEIIHKTMAQMPVDDGYIRLHQAKLLLGSSGKAPTEADDSPLQFPIANTNWELSYGLNTSAVSLDSSLMLGFILIPLGLLAAAFLLSYRRLSMMLTEDMSTTLRAFKDLIQNKFQGSYSTKLYEMKGFISTMSQYKRVLEHDSNDAAAASKDAVDESFGLSGFYTDVVDLGFDNTSAKKEKPQTPERRNDMPEIFRKPVPASVSQKVEPKAARSTSALLTADNTRVEEAIILAEKTIDPRSTLFRAYDIRGVVGKALTQDIVYDIGRALGTEAKARGCDMIVLARDGRNSSHALSEAIANGIVTTGCNVLDIGTVPTPVLYFVAHHIEDHSGVMITGSHYPAEFNGIKMVLKGETLAEEGIQNLKKCIDSRAFTLGKPGAIEKNSGYGNEYVGMVSDDVHLGRPMKVVVDCGNGVAGEIAPLLLRTIGCEVIELYCEIDGAFANHPPDPSKSENLEELIMAVEHYQADLGLDFDGDGCGLGVVDSKARIIWPDRQMMLYAQHVLAAWPGSEIIFDVKCSRHLAGQINKYGGRPTLWKSGPALMKAKLQETGAGLAGDMSGHIFFNDRWFGFDDALYTAARLIEILSEDTRTSAEVFAALPDSLKTRESSVTLEEGENLEIIEKLLQTAKFPGAEVTTIDGLRVDFPDGFGLVRASNTTPSLELRFEADSNEALINIQQQFGQLLKTVKPDSILTF